MGDQTARLYFFGVPAKVVFRSAWCHNGGAALSRRWLATWVPEVEQDLHAQCRQARRFEYLKQLLLSSKWFRGSPPPQA